MGIRISVYRDNDGDCTNRGISYKCDYLTVVNIDGPSKPTDDAPAVKLANGPYNTIRIIPADETRFVMFGGNFGFSCDSGFNEACSKMLGVESSSMAVKIFDRIEN